MVDRVRTLYLQNLLLAIFRKITLSDPEKNYKRTS